MNTYEDATTSHWLRDAIKSLENRDIVDALNDVEILLESLNVRYTQLVNGDS